MNTNATATRPIGVFDSGVGGLTVLRAIRRVLPSENLLYLGDTARLPYGTKSPASISRYACQASEKLVERDIKMLVVACNTASAVALQSLRDQFPRIPVLGVVEPGAHAAVAANPGGVHRVLATEATVRLGAYRAAIESIDPAATVEEQACEMLVSLAEEGWTEGAIATACVQRYFDEVAAQPAPHTIILGCTHFPLLQGVIAAVAGEQVRVVDSASTTAEFVRRTLAESGHLCTVDRPGDLHLMATDGCTRFARVGGQFLGQPLSAGEIELVDL